MIQYDSREQQTENGIRRINSIKERMQNLVCEHLPTGDYLMIFPDKQIPIECCTFSELVQSLNSGRKNDQLARCRQFDESWLIYENADHRNLQSIIRLVSHQRAGTMILQSIGPYFTGQLIAMLYHYYNRPKIGQSLKHRVWLDDSPELAKQEQMLTAGTGIGPEVATEVIKHAGTINNLCFYDYDELEQIPKVGSEKAKEIFKLLHHEILR